MSCCSRRQCVCGVITSLVQRGCDLPVNVDFCRMSFDPNKAKTPCGDASQHSLKFLPQVSIAPDGTPVVLAAKAKRSQNG